MVAFLVCAPGKIWAQTCLNQGKKNRGWNSLLDKTDLAAIVYWLLSSEVKTSLSEMIAAKKLLVLKIAITT